MHIEHMANDDDGDDDYDNAVNLIISHLLVYLVLTATYLCMILPSHDIKTAQTTFNIIKT